MQRRREEGRRADRVRTDDAGKATPQLTAYNTRIGKLGLAERFPIDKVALKRCTATSS